MASSLRRTDILALSNLRNDGRRPEEIRRMRIQMGPLAIATTAMAGEAVGGSALVEMGLTVALATVRGPIECTRRSDELTDRYVLKNAISWCRRQHL
jgi:ribonuclease PH